MINPSGLITLEGQSHDDDTRHLLLSVRQAEVDLEMDRLLSSMTVHRLVSCQTGGRGCDPSGTPNL